MMLGLACIGFILYLIPAMIAQSRRISNVNGVAILNFLLGWTVIGWIAALIWAVSEKPKQLTPDFFCKEPGCKGHGES